MPFNLPILLTWLRIVAIPLLIAVYYLPADGASSHERDVMAFGAFLDPVADKLMVAAALIILVQLGRADAIVATIIIGREITISALREWMAKIGASKSVAVSMLGKIKTAAQMIAIPLLLYHSPFLGSDSRILGNWLIWIAALLTLWSMGYYLRMAWPEIAERSEGK